MGEIEAQYEPMLSAPEQPVELEEERAGVLSRVREMAVGAWDTVSRHPKEMLAIGAASFACANAAELSLAADPVVADTGNVPTLTHKGNLKQYCGKQIFARQNSKVEVAELGKPGQEYQDIFIKIGFGAVDPVCNGHFKRLASERSMLIRHGKTINEDEGWVSLLSKGDTNAAGDAGFDDLNSHQNPALYYKHGDKAQFKLRLQEFNVATKKVVKTVIRKFPIKVK